MFRLRMKFSPIASFFLIIISILLFMLLLGQGLGRFYLAKITCEMPETTLNKNLPSRASTFRRELNPKKKVLRLNQVEYYTLLLLTAEQREQALALGQELGQKGLPVIVTGEGPYEVLLGFVNKETALLTLKEKIKVEDLATEIRRDYLNKVAFKFTMEDTFAAEKIAPFLGRVSLCLEKGLFLYQGTVVNEEIPVALRPKFLLLADSLVEVAQEGQVISQESKEVGSLAELCRQWAASLRLVEQEWTDLTLLKSQQRGLMLLEEYHRMIKKTN